MRRTVHVHVRARRPPSAADANPSGRIRHFIGHEHERLEWETIDGLVRFLNRCPSGFICGSIIQAETRVWHWDPHVFLLATDGRRRTQMSSGRPWAQTNDLRSVRAGLTEGIANKGSRCSHESLRGGDLPTVVARDETAEASFRRYRKLDPPSAQH